jgi:hypothetical protein
VYVYRVTASSMDVNSHLPIWGVDESGSFYGL